MARGSASGGLAPLLPLVALLGPRCAAALPPPALRGSDVCAGGLCDEPDMKYERFVDVQPGDQWGDAGGYCGSWASQRAFLGIGAWVSQQQVRDRTTHCQTPRPNGGHDSEILSCNIDEAWKALKIDYDAFDFTASPVPQTAAFAAWLKKQLVAGYVVAWMIMWNHQNYPIYNLTPPAGMYGHIEPVIGIQSNHPLDDETVYPDDTVLHYMDAGSKTLHRNFSSMPCKWAGVGAKADCGAFSYGISYPWGFVSASPLCAFREASAAAVHRAGRRGASRRTRRPLSLPERCSRSTLGSASPTLATEPTTRAASRARQCRSRAPSRPQS